MSIVLVWRAPPARRSELAAERVAARLGRLFSPLFDGSIAVRSDAIGGNGWALLELPLRGWALPREARADSRWAFAIEPLIGPEAENGSLLDLARRLEQAPLDTLAALAPPFALLSTDAIAESVTVENDALGMSQLFELEADGLWALTNRPLALAALGHRLEPVIEDWALWATLDWFPLDRSGFRNLRHLPGGSRIVASPAGVRRERRDAVARWVAPESLARDAALDLACEALRTQLASAARHWHRPDVSLTGGRDSRAVVATLRALGITPELSVRGLDERADVVLARRLATIAGLPLEVRSGSGLPSDTPAGLERSLDHALLWQAGQCAPHRATTFLAGGGFLRPRRPSVTGQHGELARRDRAIFADEELEPGEVELWSAGQAIARARASVASYLPESLRPEAKGAVLDLLPRLFAHGDAHGLEGLARLDAFALFELTRRKGGALHAWQSRLLVAPFLAPDLLRALFAVPGGLAPGEVHRTAIERFAPDWSGVPFTDARDATGRAHSSAPTSWRHPVGRENYDRDAYWSEIGRPLLDRALARGGFWTRVFDPDQVVRRWPDDAPQVALLDLLERRIDSTTE